MLYCAVLKEREASKLLWHNNQYLGVDCGGFRWLKQQPYSFVMVCGWLGRE